MITVTYIIEKTYENWIASIKDMVGGNYSMENSTVVSELPYASMYFVGLPSEGMDLEKNESGVVATVQIDIFANGQKAVSSAYSIDEKSHSAMTKMGYERTQGPEMIQNIDPSIKRLTSRYRRTFGYDDTL